MIIPLIVCLYCAFEGHAQDFILQATPEEYNEAIYAQKLVRNRNLVVPLQRLDTLRMATWFQPSPLASVLQSATDQYLPANHLQTLSDGIGKANAIIMGLGRDHDLDAETFRLITAQALTITLIFDREVYDMLPLDQADAVIHAFNPDSINCHVSIQQIFGGIHFGAYSVMIPDIDRLGFAPPALAGMDSRKLHSRIDSIATLAIKSRATPGIQVVAIRNGKVIFNKAYGYHTYDSIQRVKRTDIYDLASITKVTSGLPLLMQLYAEGIFDLDGTLAEYVPFLEKSNKATLRWREILAHQARLMPWIPYWRNTVKKNGKFKWSTFKSRQTSRFPVQVTEDLFLHRKYRKKMFKAIKKSPLNVDSGFVYSGLSFYLMPKMIERLTGAEFEPLLKREVFHPLGAYNITYNPLRFYDPERIIPTERDTFFRMTQLHGYVHDEGAAMMGGVSCNAGLFSTAIDLAKVAQMYLNKGKYGGAQVIPAAAVEEFTSCAFCDQGNHRGLGFDRPALNKEEIAESTSYCASVSQSSFGHSGYTGTLMWIDPDKELIFIFLSNRVYPTRLNRKLYEMKIRPQIHQVLYDAIDK